MSHLSSEQGTISWRRASAPDISLLLKLMESYYGYEGIAFVRSKAESALSKLINEAHLGEILLILYSNEIVGYVALTNGFSLEYGGKYQFIDELFIMEQFRGNSLGTKTLKYIAENAQQNEVLSLHLEVEIDNLAAQRLYKAQGFEDCGRHLWSKDLT